MSTKTIWKFPLLIGQVLRVEMPLHSQLLTAQVQNNQAVIWALVDPKQDIEVRYFELFATGQTIPELDGKEERQYIATFQVDNGDYVFHLFELKIKKIERRTTIFPDSFIF